MVSVKCLLKLVATAVIFISFTAQALPIIQADAFVKGDNKAVQQISNGLIWLDFGITNSQPVIDVINQLNSTYIGWRLPTETEVFNLFSELGQNAGSIQARPGLNHWANLDVSGIFDIWGSNAIESDDDGNGYSYRHEYATAWYFSDNNALYRGSLFDYKRSDYGTNYSHNSIEIYGFSAHSYEWIHYFRWESHSTFLVKTGTLSSVPEPTSLFLLVLGLLGLTVARRSRTAQ